MTFCFRFMDNQRGVQFSVLSQHSLIKTQGDSASNFGDPSVSCQEGFTSFSATITS